MLPAQLHIISPHFGLPEESDDNYPARACASKGLCDRSWRLYIVVVYCIYIVYKSALFFGTNLLSPKILTLRYLF